MTKHDAVNNPSHYSEGRKYEPIRVIEDWQLGYHLGNALKYISRAGRKFDATEDLRKAVWYIERHIEVLEEEVTEHEPARRKAGFVDIYQEILNMHYRDANTFTLNVPTQDVDDAPLDYWAEDSILPGDNVPPRPSASSVWDSDDDYMTDCGWDPNSGPTC